MEDDKLENENTEETSTNSESDNESNNGSTGENSSENESQPAIDVDELTQKLSEIEFTLSNESLKNIEEQLKLIVNKLSLQSKSMFTDLAVKLYVNSDFENSKKSANQIADAAIERTRIFLEKLNNL